MIDPLGKLIENNDPDPLLREVDIRCDQRDWAGLLEIHDRCNAATERGKTLWGVAEHAAYRLALEATGEFAAIALTSDSGPLALGPLPEVAASTHEWSELTAHIEDGPTRGITAYECVALGEDLSTDKSLHAHQSAFEMPLELFDWEPSYVHAEYLEHEARFPAPVLEAAETRSLSTSIEFDELDHRSSIDTWREIVLPWTTQSNGHAVTAGTIGDVDTAIFGVAPEISIITRLSTNDALKLLCWAAASGGAHGRRRGLAFGRSMVWRVLAETCGLMDEGEMPNGDELGKHVPELQWWTWGNLDFTQGWNLRLAVHDSVDGVSFAINARDSLD